MAKIRILFIIPSLNIGGSERKVVDLASHLDRNRFEPSILCITEYGPLKTELDNEKIPAFCVHKKSALDFLVIFRIRRWIKRLKIDIIHLFTSTGKLWGRLAVAGLKNVRVISTEESLFRGSRLDVFFERRFRRRTDVIVANSHSTMMSAQEKTKIEHSKYRVIPNGINIDAYRETIHSAQQDPSVLGTLADQEVILCAARFDRRKGHRYLLEAMVHILKEKPNTQLVLAGEGETKDAMKDLALSLGIQHRVVFLDYCQDLRTLYRAADVLVLPSTEEGFGNVIVEAMASGLVVAASAVGGIPEIIEPEVNGLLFPAKDSMAIAKVVLRLLGDPELRERLRQQALQNLDRFSLATQMTAYHRLYEDLMQSGRNRS